MVLPRLLEIGNDTIEGVDLFNKLCYFVQRFEFLLKSNIMKTTVRPTS